MAGVYVISIRFVKDRKPPAVIEAVLQTVGIWLRFSPDTYLLRSEKDATAIFNALGSIMTKMDQELIFKVDTSDYSGWTAKWIDDWIAGRPYNVPS